MFTGIITHKVKIISKQDNNNALQIILTRPHQISLNMGDSIALNGVCTTIDYITTETFGCHLISETLQATNLGTINIGENIHFETALKVGQSLSGHFVTGHIDFKAPFKILTTSPEPRLSISIPPKWSNHFVSKGSVTIDGISLTVMSHNKDSFEVHLIPHTWELARFSQIPQQSLLNIETDILGKYTLNKITPS